MATQSSSTSRCSMLEAEGRTGTATLQASGQFGVPGPGAVLLVQHRAHCGCQRGRVLVQKRA